MKGPSNRLRPGVRTVCSVALVAAVASCSGLPFLSQTPEDFFTRCVAERGFVVSNVSIDRTLEGVMVDIEQVGNPALEEAQDECEVLLYEEFGIPVKP